MITTPPAISEQKALLEQVLTAYAQQFTGATVSRVPTMAKLWMEVYSVSTKPRFVFCCAGETARGAFSQANTLHRVDRRWSVAILRGTGWGLQAAPGEVDFDDLLEEVRDYVLRSLWGLTEEPPIDYKNWTPIPPNLAAGQAANTFIEGAIIEFSTANDLPAITAPTPPPTP